MMQQQMMQQQMMMSAQAAQVRVPLIQPPRGVATTPSRAGDQLANARVSALERDFNWYRASLC
jgi:hypothetical protein